MQSDTARKAYWEELLSGRVTKQQAQVLDDILHSGAGTRAEISRTSGLPINVVCGRCKELIDLGYIKVKNHTIDDNTHKEVEVLGLV
jgi:hypothetical protein